MPEPSPDNASHNRLRQQLEEQLLAELKAAEVAFRTAPPGEKEAASDRYRQALERFNEVIVHRRMPAGSAGDQ